MTDPASGPTLGTTLDTALDTALDTTAPTYTCSHCDVTWQSTDPTCWLCTRTADPKHTLPTTQRGIPAGHRPTGPLWASGLDHREAHALGLPDPRAPRVARAISPPPATEMDHPQ